MVGRRITNKKRQTRSCFPAPLAMVLTLAATLALSYVWLCSRNEALAASIRELEEQQEQVQRRLVTEEFKWSQLLSPRSVERALARFDLPLVWPSERQLVHLSRPLRMQDLSESDLTLPQVATRASWLLDGKGHD